MHATVVKKSDLGNKNIAADMCGYVLRVIPEEMAADNCKQGGKIIADRLAYKAWETHRYIDFLSRIIIPVMKHWPVCDKMYILQVMYVHIHLLYTLWLQCMITPMHIYMMMQL